MMRTEGIFVVTARSRANIRSNAGTQYSIVATANWGAELPYYGESKKASNGVTWHKVIATNGRVGWISSTVGTLH